MNKQTSNSFYHQPDVIVHKKAQLKSCAIKF